MRLLSALVVCLIAAAPTAAQEAAVVVDQRTALAATGSIDWSVLGPAGTIVDSLPRTVAGAAGGALVDFSINAPAEADITRLTVGTLQDSASIGGGVVANGTGLSPTSIRLTIRFLVPVRSVGADIAAGAVALTSGAFPSGQTSISVRAFDRTGAELGAFRVTGGEGGIAVDRFLGFVYHKAAIARVEVEASARDTIGAADILQARVALNRLDYEPDPHALLSTSLSDITTALTLLDGKIDSLDAAVDGLAAHVGRDEDVDGLLQALSGKVDSISASQATMLLQLDTFSGRMNTIEQKLDQLISLVTALGPGKGPKK